MSGYLAGWFIHQLIKGKTAKQVERGFWTFVAMLVIFFIVAWSVLSVMEYLQPRPAREPAPIVAPEPAHSSR